MSPYSAHVKLLRRMPPAVRVLREPWPSLLGQVPELSQELERSFRAGQRVSRLQSGYVIGGSLKGGSSSMWVPTDEVAYEAYCSWRAREAFAPSDDRAGFERLLELLGRHGIALSSGSDEHRAEGAGAFDRRYGEVYGLIEAILAALPPAHLGRSELARLEIGGWGADGAKASAYRDGTIHLYDFALKGARRTCAGLLLHELGHVQEQAFEARQLLGLERAHQTLARDDAFVGLEFLTTPAQRRAYQRMAPCEFLAETYLAYAACGQSLRSRASPEGDGSVRRAWEGIYETYRQAFFGWEYE